MRAELAHSLFIPQVLVVTDLQQGRWSIGSLISCIYRILTYADVGQASGLLRRKGTSVFECTLRRFTTILMAGVSLR
jgi:hypothetical protein